MRGTLLGLLAVAGCQKTPDPAPSAPPPAPPADCDAVAAKLASFELGNYAAAAERARVIADDKAACVAALMPQVEGECVAKATDRWAAAKCAPSMFPAAISTSDADCDRVIATMSAAMPRAMSSDPKMSAQLAQTLALMKESCTADGWPDELKRCMLAARPGQVTAMQACNDKMPKALQDKMTARLMDAMQRR